MAFIADQASSSTVLLFCLGLIILYVLVGSIINYRKLSHFPGPRLAGFSRLWMLWQTINARMSRAQAAAIAKYGLTCRLGPDILITGDPDLIRLMNAAGSKWRRSGWYTAMKLDPQLDSVFSTRDEKLHAEVKAKEAGGYNGRDIDTLEPDLDARIRELLQLIRTECKDKAINISALTRFFTLDVLSTVAFGRKFGFMAANEDLYDYDKISSDFFAILELQLNHPSIRWICSTRIMQYLFLPTERDSKGVGPMLKFAKEAVAERFGPDAKMKKDMLGHFVAKGLTQVRCEVESYLQIIAGSDSTTSVLRLALYSLAANYPAYAKLRAEIERAAEALESQDSVVRYADAQKLPYLTACVWETLRMYPPLFGLKSKHAPPGGVNFKDIFIPEGTEVASCDDAVCRRKDIFGEDADVFRPDRWLDLDGETHRSLYQTVDVIFGTGRFACLGKHIAMMELHKTMFELIRHFDWIIADPVKGIETRTYGVRIQPKMMMYAYPRT